VQDKKKVIRVEITWLLAAGFIKEVYHLEWLANLVLIRKKNKEWRMCVDYTDPNKNCPKDPFGLPRIDEVIDSNRWLRALMLFRFLLWLSPDCSKRRRSDQDIIHHSVWHLLLYDHVLQAQECGCYLSKSHLALP
jgi:hypothetical protein